MNGAFNCILNNNFNVVLLIDSAALPPQLVLPDDVREGVKLLVMVVWVADVVEGVGRVDGLVRHQRTHLLVGGRRSVRDSSKWWSKLETFIFSLKVMYKIKL